MFCAAAEAAAAPAPSSRWERLKDSRAVRWGRGLASDYRDACRDMVVGSWERPLRASLYASLLGGALAGFYTKPDRASFEAALLARSNELGLLSPWIRNGVSDGHVQKLLRLQNAGRLQHASLGALALVYRSDYDSDAALYEARCAGLATPWRELPRRVLDVGFAGRWWVLDSKMKDYDVNEDEFKHLPAHMQVALPPGAQEVDRSERLHKESWLALEEDKDARGDTKEARGDTKEAREDTKEARGDTKEAREDTKEASVGEEGRTPALEEKPTAA